MHGDSSSTTWENHEADSPPPWRLAWRLAWGQLLSWGVIYYAFTALSGPMHTDTGWSRSLINGGLSLGLLSWGIFALPVGLWIQRRGAAGIMTVGSLTGGMGFAALGLVSDPWHFYLIWVVIGAAMATLLYEPAFAAVTVAFGNRYKQGIVLITLLAGFASTVFIPLSHFLADSFGWRNALLALGLFLAVTGTPLHWLGRGDRPYISNRKTSQAFPARGMLDVVFTFKNDLSDRRFALLALWFTTYAAAFSGLIFLIVPAMTSSGAKAETLLGAIVLIGPMQVLGRLILTTCGMGLSSLHAGLWAMISITLSISFLLFLPPTPLWLTCFAVLFGIGNGVMTIVKGTAIAELFGRKRYAELNGAVTAPSMISKASAPFLLSVLWDYSANVSSVFISLMTLLAIGVIAIICLEFCSEG
ncbi:MAG: MFS transporter [Verrucomicrobiales bacterium]|nr:MFS transporter [Verrucomicrobiales bacterium]